jgi:uncharacterized protein YkwD/predicted small lipoprotein YifL
MKGKLITTLVLLMILSACGNKAPVETPAPTQVETSTIPITGATATEAAAITEAPATSAAPTENSSSSTSGPSQPTNMPDCTNSASFVIDVTVPDNTGMVGDTRFVKTWRIMNTGTCIWAADYTLTYYAGDRMFSPASVPLVLTYPGKTLDLSISLKAPNTVGSYKGYFVIKNPAGLIMKINSDSRLWVIINVTSTVAATATPAPSAATGSATAGGASGNGFATVNCAYALDQARVTDVIDAVNAYRAESDLPAYNVNPQLTLAAQNHANDMACNHLFGHTGSNGSTVESRVVVSGYVASSLSENVYGSYPPLTGADAVNWWKNDKTDLRHNLNLLSNTFIDIGVGYAFFDNYGYYVIVFATP